MSELTRPDPRHRVDLTVIRGALRRSRWPRIVLVLVFALVAGESLQRAGDRAARAEHAWAPVAGVWVAARDLEAGAVINTGDVVSRSLPTVGIPRDARRDDPIGRRLRDRMVSGEILRMGRMADNTSGLHAARLPPGAGGLQLPTPAPHLDPGDLVDLYALLTGERVAIGAEVLSVDDGLPTLAIDSVDLPAVVRTFTTGDVVPVVVG